MIPAFTALTVFLLILAVLFDNAGLAAAAIICSFGGY